MEDSSPVSMKAILPWRCLTRYLAGNPGGRKSFILVVQVSRCCTLIVIPENTEDFEIESHNISEFKSPNCFVLVMPNIEAYRSAFSSAV